MNLNVLKDSCEIIYYNNPTIPIYVKKSNLSSFPNKEALCHWHEDIELLLPTKGHISYNINGKSLLINEGEAIFVNAKHMHYGYSSDQSDCEYICIVFHPKCLFPLAPMQNLYVEPVLECNLDHLIIKADSETSNQLLFSIRQLYELYNMKTIAVEIKAMSFIYQIWDSLYLLMKPFFLEDLSSFDTNVMTIKKMLSFIYQNYEEKISLNDIAISGDIGKSKCCKLFKQYLNHSPNDYLNSYRLEKSMFLLRDLSLTITEIAYACGFSNPSYYSETFLKYKGCTPSEYRLELNS